MKIIDEQLVEKILAARKAQSLLALLPCGVREHAQQFESLAVAELAAQLALTSDDACSLLDALAAEMSANGSTQNKTEAYAAPLLQIEEAALQGVAGFLTKRWKALTASGAGGAALSALLQKWIGG